MAKMEIDGIIYEGEESDLVELLNEMMQDDVGGVIFVSDKIEVTYPTYAHQAKEASQIKRNKSEFINDKPSGTLPERLPSLYVKELLERSVKAIQKLRRSER